MTIHTLPTRPTVSNPVITKQLVRCSIAVIDDNLRLLRCAADSAALADAEPELVESLYHLYKALRRECDRLLTLT